MSIDPNRPYPPGIAYDEAWRQRQRADAAEAQRDALQAACQAFIDADNQCGVSLAYVMAQDAMFATQAESTCDSLRQRADLAEANCDRWRTACCDLADAINLPGDHCEVAQAMRIIDEMIDEKDRT